MSGLHALLIGCDGYFPNCKYSQLGGCVADVTAVEEYLSREYPQSQITRLKASRREEGGDPPEPREIWPTYENMVQAFDSLLARAAPGDQVYVHYSGHGGLVPTAVPEVKGSRGLDETLVPVDVGNPQARHLRDVELVVLLRRMTERGLLVTLVLDCCHSGGAMRSGCDRAQRGPNGEIARGEPAPDMTVRPTESLVGSKEALAAGWGPPRAEGMRDGGGGSTLRQGAGWVMLAACQPREQAWAIPKGAEGFPHGAFTYEWLDALAKSVPRTTYQGIYDRILPRIRKREFVQRPELFGDATRIVFGKDHLPSSSTVVVTQIERDGKVLLDAGVMQGVLVGARFAVFDATATLSSPADQLAVLEVDKVGVGDLSARIVGPPPSRPLATGDKALWLYPGAIELQSSVRVVEPPAPVAPPLRAALAALRTTLSNGSSGFVRPATGKEPEHLQVRVGSSGDWEILDAHGERLAFPSVPALSPLEADAASRLVRRLAHLTKLRNLERLENRGEEASRKGLTGRLGVEWVGYPAGVPRRAKAGEPLTLRVVNHSTYDVAVTVLALRSDGSARQMSLGGDQATSVLLQAGTRTEAGGSFEHTLTAELAPGEERTMEKLKIFATRSALTNFRWLELPDWNGKPRPRPALRTDDLLEALFASLAGEWRERAVALSGRAELEWTVETLDLEIEA